MSKEKTPEDISNFEHDKLDEKEKEEAKNNGFILVGKTGNGKTTLLNAIFGKEVGKADNSAQSVTQESKVYYYKLTNGKVVTLIDTPGLGDSNKTFKEDIDDQHLQGITKIISDENIHIKGILFLVNFQKKRFDADEQAALLNYNRIFPLKNFWKQLVVIFTHFFTSPVEDDDEETMIQKTNEANSEIFEKIMDKVKEVSDVISYEELQKKYFDSYSKANNNKKRKINAKNREELEILFDELIKNGPLFHQVEIKHLKNYKWKEGNKEYIGEVEIIGFFDFNKTPIKERTNVIKKEEVRPQQNYAPPTCNYSVYRGGYNSSGRLCYQSSSGTESNSHYKSMAVGGVTGATALAGVVAGGAIIAEISTSSVAIGIAAAASTALPPAAPFIIAGSVIGLGIGALFGKLFD